MKLLLLFLMGAAIGFLAGVFRKEILGFLTEKRSSLKKATFGEAKPESVSRAVAYDRNAAIEQFCHVQEKFHGIYESLYQVAMNAGSDGDLEDWNTRLESLRDCPDLKALWSDTKATPVLFLEFLKDCGVKRDGRTELVADENTRYCYVEFDGADILVNEEYSIIQPYWYNGTVVLGKGIIKLVK